MIGVLITLAFLAANAFFVGAEFAYVVARRARMEELAAEGNRSAAIAAGATRELSFMLAGAQLGITMSSIALGAVAEPAIATSIERAIAPFITIPPAALHTISFIVALSIVLYFHLVVGEHIPKNIAIAKPDESLLWIARPFNIFSKVFGPFIRLLNGMANTSLRLVGVQPKDELFAAASPADIASILRVLRKEAVIDEPRHRLLSGTVTFSRLDAKAVMVPRPEVLAVSAKSSVAEIEKVVMDSGRTRLPVYEDDIGHLVGFVHAKDILKVPPENRDRPLPRSLLREMLVVLENRQLGALLTDMRRSRKHLAVVIDEHGETAGIVTLEDVLEEIVGEISDEFERDVLKVDRVGPDRFLVQGKLRPDELEVATGLMLPQGDYETLGGFLMASLGRVPKVGDVVAQDSGTLKVRRMRGRRVDLIEVALDPSGGDTPVRHQQA